MSRVVPEGLEWNARYVPVPSTKEVADNSLPGCCPTPVPGDSLVSSAAVIPSLSGHGDIVIGPGFGDAAPLPVIVGSSSASAPGTFTTLLPYNPSQQQQQQQPHSHSVAPASSCAPPSSLPGRACYFLLGAGMLAAWNSLITATDYFGAVYPGWHTDRLFTVSYLPVCLLILVIGIRFPDLPPQPCRIRLGYAGFTVAMAVVPLLDAFFMAPASEGGVGGDAATAAVMAPAPVGGLVAVVVCVAVVGACDGLCQGALFAEAAQLPPPYTQAVVSGTASSGLLVCLLRIASKASFEAGADSATDRARGLRDGTRLYFALAGLLSLSCWILYDVVLPRLRTLPARGPTGRLKPPRNGPLDSCTGTATKGCGIANHDHGHDHDYVSEHHPLLLPQPLELSTECKSNAGSDEGRGNGSGDLGRAVADMAVEEGGPYPTTLTAPSTHSHSTQCNAVVAVVGATIPPILSSSLASKVQGDMDSCGDAVGYHSWDDGDKCAVPHASGSGSGSGGLVLVHGADGDPSSASQHSNDVLVKSKTDYGKRVEDSAWPRGGAAAHHDGGVRQQIQRCLELGWPLCGSLFVTYTVTLSIFPGFLAEDVHSAKLGDWYPILLITAYNLADFFGKSLPVLEPLVLKLRQLQDLPQPQVKGPELGLQQQPQRSSPPPMMTSEQQRQQCLWTGNEEHDPGHSYQQQQQLDHPHMQQAPLLSSQPCTTGDRGYSNAGASGGGGRYFRHGFGAACSRLAEAVLLPLRQPRGLLLISLLRGAVALAAFLGAARWQAPAWLMAVLTAALGVSNGYLTTQILTMGPAAVLSTPTLSASPPTPMLTGTDRPTVLPSASSPRSPSISVTSQNGLVPQREPAPVRRLAGSDDKVGPRGTAAVVGGGGGGYEALSASDPYEQGIVGAAWDVQSCKGRGAQMGWCSLGEGEVQGQGWGGDQVISSSHIDAEVVETLLVISLVAGLNAGAYLGWLWLLRKT